MSNSSPAISPKFTLSGLLLIIVLCFFTQPGQSQVTEHSFKIIGLNEKDHKFTVTTIVNFKSGIISGIEYDPLSADHLYISYHTGDLKLNKTCYLFKGKKFNPSAINDYLANKELLKDGLQQVYSETQTLESELIYKKDTLQQQTSFYSNGNRHMLTSGDEKFLNGAFKMWHPNGQPGFMGNYQKNLKEGVFESFDTLGNSLRKGTYREGKLVEGMAVVQDIIYDAPETPVRYKGNDSILNLTLLKKTASLADVKERDSTFRCIVDLKFTILKTGQLKRVDITNTSTPLATEVVQNVFSKQFMNFEPATIEGVPVGSYFNKSFLLTNKGLETYDALKSQANKLLTDTTVYIKVDQMPQFPGGEKAMMSYLKNTMKYPRLAVEQKIHGKVFVNFVIREDGAVSNVHVVRSAHPLLDLEACRVVKAMPRWIPGLNAGKAVRVKFTIPLSFEFN